MGLVYINTVKVQMKDGKAHVHVGRHVCLNRQSSESGAARRRWGGFLVTSRPRRAARRYQRVVDSGCIFPGCPRLSGPADGLTYFLSVSGLI